LTNMFTLMLTDNVTVMLTITLISDFCFGQHISLLETVDVTRLSVTLVTDYNIQ